MNRRSALGRIGTFALAGTLDVDRIGEPHGRKRQNTALRKIATEEACTFAEVAGELRKVVRAGGSNLDLRLLKSIYDAPPGVEPRFLPELLDFDAKRLVDMDRHGVSMHVLSLTAPGVQMFDAKTGASLATLSNDRLADIVRRHPKRYAALASFAPQDPQAAVKEMERAVNTLRLNGFIVNSHTNNEYLDQARYWPILEAAEALDAPLYIHPRAPSDGMAAPFRDYALESAAWGYGMETGTHAVRLMLSGVLDRFPKLRIILGHMGEGIPFWMWRLDFMGAPGGRAAGRSNRLKPSEYFQRNFAITTSGVEDPLALRYCIDRLGVDNIMWAIDYPYQTTAPAVSFIETAPMSDSDRRKIAHGNAERIFRIGSQG
ncbi:MAG: amidohydrolase family protein [Gemmatimonadaceae bacterium]